jgi:hypothetical protein
VCGWGPRLHDVMLNLLSTRTISPLFSMALPARSGPRPLIQFRNHFSQTVGLLGGVISSPEGQHKHRIKRIHTPNIHGLSGIRAHDLSVRAREGSSRLRPRGYCNRPVSPLPSEFQKIMWGHILTARKLGMAKRGILSVV